MLYGIAMLLTVLSFTVRALSSNDVSTGYISSIYIKVILKLTQTSVKY